MLNQQTIASPFALSGVGLHSGQQSHVRVMPAEPDAGRYFVQNGYQIPVHVNAVASTVLSTELRANSPTNAGAEVVAVRTVEHLLSALMGMGIDNACIEIDNAELPILDGSALPWVEAIAKAGIQTQSSPRQIVTLSQVVSVYNGDRFVVAIPAPNLMFSYGIDFPTQAIGKQWFSWSPDEGDFAADIAPARTFTMAEQVEQLRAAGLIKGGSLGNAIVCDAHNWLNPPLRFANEPCRHKLLDLIGDLSLLGWLPQAHIVAYKASHDLHAKFVKALMEANQSIESR